ncbi:hypothetical protein QYE76_021706 [Lolium multiflorum]|uniref:Reverse transcriptase domain-containing protein n=1 Tax=Lolium multiflorum TaxID=4521 RepID=A0AAD8VR53_LOLMU|nr:hypothetical protein QYE76_021706 [Lolium multiflorum]
MPICATDFFRISKKKWGPDLDLDLGPPEFRRFFGGGVVVVVVVVEEEEVVVVVVVEEEEVVVVVVLAGGGGGGGGGCVGRRRRRWWWWWLCWLEEEEEEEEEEVVVVVVVVLVVVVVVAGGGGGGGGRRWRWWWWSPEMLAGVGGGGRRRRRRRWWWSPEKEEVVVVVGGEVRRWRSSTLAPESLVLRALHSSTNNLHLLLGSYWFDNLGFFLRENLPLCASYLPLGVPNGRVHLRASLTFSHTAKASILHTFFKSLLGTPLPASDNLNLSHLVQSTSLDSSQAASLIRPLTLEEIRDALFPMNDNSSPGPDGFGHAFFKRNWDLVKHDLLVALADFHSLSTDMLHINKSHIVLLPKKAGANKPENFCPMSLQNCCLKVHSKCLTLHLRGLIPYHVHPDQTGFISGRSIAENFVYAADIVQPAIGALPYYGL